MKIRITAGGIFGRDGEIKPGSEFDLNDEPPAAWKGKYEVISHSPAKGSVPITNDAPDAELIKAAIEGLDPKNDKHWTKAGLPEVDAVKAALGADVTRAQIDAAAPEAKRPTE